MDKKLIKELSCITEEEKAILSGDQIRHDIYFTDNNSVIDSAKMLKLGQLINVRTHTRFIYFPTHSHNFIEMQYVCRGKVTNIIDGKEIVIKEGELLLLAQNIKHAIKPASENDVIVNFIVLPEFLDIARKMIKGKNILSEFLMDTMRSGGSKTGVLHFKSADNIQIQNLIENMLYSLVHKKFNNDDINRATMGVLFMHLANSLEDARYVSMPGKNDMIMVVVMKYIETFYRSATLNELSLMTGKSDYNLSKLIKAETSYTFSQLVQAKKFRKAIELLCETDMSISDIVVTVGYENSSYFHRKFREKYDMSPSQFRKENKNKDIINL